MRESKIVEEVVIKTKHVVGVTTDGVNDALASKKTNFGIAVVDAADAAHIASDVLIEPGLGVIICAVLTSSAIIQRLQNYEIYAVSITIRVGVGFVLLAFFLDLDFSQSTVLVLAIRNDCTSMIIAEDCVKPSPVPDSLKMRIFFSSM